MDEFPPKDPDDIDSRFFVMCDEDGTNDGSAQDSGELQGATISSYTVTVPSGLTKDSDNSGAVTIKGRTYAANTVITVWLSGGTHNNDYNILFRATLSDGRQLDKTIVQPVRTQ